MSSDDGTTKRRVRVSKACNNCRKKKIKCDGATTCSNCVSSSSSCLYSTDEERKAKISKGRMESKLFKTESIKDLQKRMGRLESMLGAFLESSEVQKIKNKYESNGSEHIQKDQTYGDYSSEPIVNEKTYGDEKQLDVSKTLGEDTTFDKTKQGKRNTVVELPDYYHGSHSLFNIFSAKSIAWIRSKLSDEEDMDVWTPVENMPRIIAHLAKPLVNIFSQSGNYGWPSVDELLQSNKALVYDVLQYYNSIFMANFICDGKELMKMFDDYYNSKEHKSKKLYNDDIFIMSSVLNLCMEVAVSHLLYDKDDPKFSSNGIDTPALSAYDPSEILRIQLALLNLLFFCYAKSSIIGSSIRRIQGVVFFFLFVETSWIKCSGNYTMVGLAVRYAQEIGLNRYESFQDLPFDEQVKRRRLWSLCQYFDQEVCYRSGMPPVINQSDCTTMTPLDPFMHDESNRQKLYNYEHFDNAKFSIANCVKIGSFTSQFNRIRADSYTTLFSGTAKFSNFEDMLSAVDNLNERTFDAANTFDDWTRPKFYNNPEFQDSTNYLLNNYAKGDLEGVILSHLTFFVHLMIINRLPSLACGDDMEANFKSIKIRNYFLDSARTILHLTLKLDSSKCQLTFTAWASFYPTVAFLVLIGNCLSNPNSAETYQDVSLLIDFSINFSAKSANRNIRRQFKPMIGIFNREAMTDLLSRIMLHVLLRVLEKKNGYSFVAHNPALRKHLEQTRSLWPLMYEKRGYPEERVNVKFYDFDTYSNTSNSTLRGTPSSMCKDSDRDVASSASLSTSDSTVMNDKGSPGFSSLSNNTMENRNKNTDLSNLESHQSDDLLDVNNNLISDYLTDSPLSSLLYSQVNSMPNFFFDS